MNQNKTVKELLLYGKHFLKQQNIDTAYLDAEVLLMYVLNFSKVQLFSCDKQIVNDSDEQKYIEFINQRANRMPIQYIVQHQEFMSLDFQVNNYTLIPRADTEILVETVLDYSKTNNIKYILDIGTGTGCIPISLAYYSDIKSVAVDIDDKTLQVAKYNAQKNNVLDKIQFIQSNLFNKVPNIKFDAIISNPPYIPTDDIKNLICQVKDYEPLNALDGGADGLYFYRQITQQALKYIHSGGFLFYEIGYNQGDDITKIMKANNIKDIKIIKDLANLNRVIIGKI